MSFIRINDLVFEFDRMNQSVHTVLSKFVERFSGNCPEELLPIHAKISERLRVCEAIQNNGQVGLPVVSELFSQMKTLEKDCLELDSLMDLL